VAVLVEDPALGEQLDEEALSLARRVTAKTIQVEAGPWDFAVDPKQLSGHLGLLVLEGLLTRKLRLGELVCQELLGQGDVLRPWTYSGQEPASIPAEASWQVLQPASIALLDRRFTATVARWPEITSAIVDRAVNRARWLVFHLAVCHLVRVDMRLHMTFWHFADRWGRVTTRGVRLELALTHEMLASIVGAQRPSVTTALGKLRDERKLERLDDGSWLLLGEPPREFETFGAQSTK
jgi:CRP/FNR family transcriptional regulator, cyclic AMP receptor protein